MLSNKELRKRAKNIIDLKGILIMTIIIITSIFLTLKISPIINNLLWRLIDKTDGLRGLLIEEHITIISLFISFNIVSLISGYFSSSVILDITEEKRLSIETFRRRVNRLYTYLKVKMITLLFQTLFCLVIIVIEIILATVCIFSALGMLQRLSEGAGISLWMFFIFLIFIIFLLLPALTFAYIYANTYALSYIALQDKRDLSVKDIFIENKRFIKGNSLKITLLIMTFTPLMALSLMTLGVFAFYAVTLLMITMSLKYKDIIDG